MNTLRWIVILTFAAYCLCLILLAFMPKEPWDTWMYSTWAALWLCLGIAAARMLDKINKPPEN